MRVLSFISGATDAKDEATRKCLQEAKLQGKVPYSSFSLWLRCFHLRLCANSLAIVTTCTISKVKLICSNNRVCSSSPVGVYSDSDGELIFLLQGQQGGVTHVMFSPDGTKLYSGGRKVHVWELE